MLKPVSLARVALLSSSCHFVAGDDPRPLGVADMTQEEATRRIGEFLNSTPRLSVIPSHTPTERLRVRHGEYDIRGALADPNVAFPLERMRQMASAGLIGELAADAYSTSRSRALRVACHDTTCHRRTNTPELRNELSGLPGVRCTSLKFTTAVPPNWQTTTSSAA